VAISMNNLAAHPGKGITASRLLRRAGLRPTRQRVALAALLFGNGDRHVTAEMLHEEAVRAGVRVSLATVYNTLHQFKRAGLLREIAIGGQRAYFDTNTSNHNHFFVEAEGQLVDIPGDSIRVEGVPEPPGDLKVAHIDVVVRLVAK
jgi:Fur family iron response transcriptional regulator